MDQIFITTLELSTKFILSFKSKISRRLIIVLFILGYMNGYCQGIFEPRSTANKFKIEAVKTSHAIKIDGKLNEEEWTRCRPVSNFLQIEPSHGKPASFDTEVKVLYDDKNIYIGAVCHNGKNKLYIQDLRRDFAYRNNELFAVVFDPFKDVQNPVPAFCVTPFGSQRDLLAYDDRIFDTNWDAVWQTASSVEDSSWSTEIAIPWSSLRYPPDSTSWGINFNRNIRSLNELTGWSPWPMAYSVCRMSYAGLVTNLHPPKRGANIRLQPYSLVNSNKGITDNKTSVKPMIGGEVKWLMNTNTSLEATLNTDFAQAEVDRQIINLKRSSVFFPERRQFFLENANLFSLGSDGLIQPFFSRKIGLDKNNNPLPIDQGLRFIHQSSKNAIGALAIKQSDPETKKATYFGVFRAQENIGTNKRLGGMLNYTFDELNRNTNLVGTLDGFLRISEPLYTRPMISMTMPNKNQKSGFAFFNEFSYAKNKISFNWLQTIVDKYYSPNSGYLARTDFINTHPELAFLISKKWLNGKIRYYIPSIKADVYHQMSNKEFLEANITLSPIAVQFQKGTVLSFNVMPSWENIKDQFDIVKDVHIQKGSYHYLRWGANFSTNLSAPYSAEGEISTGNFYDGSLTSIYCSVRFVPLLKMALNLSYTCNRFTGFLSKKIITTNLLAPELRLALNPKIQLSSFYQYNTVTNLGALNMRFSWEYKPLSFIYLVYNNQKTIDPKSGGSTINDRNAILKLTYIHQL